MLYLTLYIHIGCIYSENILNGTFVYITHKTKNTSNNAFIIVWLCTTDDIQHSTLTCLMILYEGISTHYWQRRGLLKDINVVYHQHIHICIHL